MVHLYGALNAARPRPRGSATDVLYAASWHVGVQVKTGCKTVFRRSVKSGVLIFGIGVIHWIHTALLDLYSVDG